MIEFRKNKREGGKVSLLVTDKKPSVVGVSQIEMIGKVKPNGYDADESEDRRGAGAGAGVGAGVEVGAGVGAGAGVGLGAQGSRGERRKPISLSALQNGSKYSPSSPTKIEDRLGVNV